MVVALELHNGCSYIVAIELHKLHMYTISRTMNYILCNSCKLFDNTNAHRNTLNCNELQIAIATQKPNCKVNWKSPLFLIVNCH